MLAAGYLEAEHTGDLFLNPGSFNIARNVATNFSSTVVYPVIDPNSYIHPLASVMGNVTLEEGIMVSPGASIRGDEGQPILIGKASNVQDGAVIHGLETEEFHNGEWEYTENRQFDSGGNRVSDGSGYCVYIGKRVSLAHQSQIHGPGYVGDNTFIAMQSLIFNAKVGAHCVVEPGCTIIGVEIGDNVYVPAGSVITKQSEANALLKITPGYTYEYTNEAVVHVNESLAAGYLEAEATGTLFLDPNDPHIARNVATNFSSTVTFPTIDPNSYIHPLASVIGNVTLGAEIMASPGSSVRGDEGQPILVSDGANIQDGVVLHSLETEEFHDGEWEYKAGRQFNAAGERVNDGSGYSIYIGKGVSLAHQSHIHGPAHVGEHTFIGMQSLIFNAKIGANCVVEPGCIIIGVEIKDGAYVPAGSIITKQSKTPTKVWYNALPSSQQPIYYNMLNYPLSNNTNIPFISNYMPDFQIGPQIGLVYNLPYTLFNYPQSGFLYTSQFALPPWQYTLATFHPLNNWYHPQIYTNWVLYSLYNFGLY